jgi:predicted phosphohydrolase
MTIWAIADLHLSFGVPDKEMDVFGEKWKNHHEKIRANWLRLIKQEDLVLLPGDISWGLHPEEAVPDLEWIHALPGTKVMIRGNHDYWWTSLSKVERVLPSSIHVIQNNVFSFNDAVICGARMWDTPEYLFGPYIEYIDNPKAKKLTEVDMAEEREKIFVRELGRLEMSLKMISKIPDHQKKIKIAMTHYPPVGADLAPSRVSKLLEQYGVAACCFGHLHNVKEGSLPFGRARGVNYLFTAADYINFQPVEVVP